MRSVLWASILLVTVVFAAPSMAQSDDAPQPGPENKTLYLHSETGQDGWMNALEVDGAAEAICYKAPTATPIGDLCPNPGEAFSYVFELAPALGHDLILDPDGTIDVEVYWGGACCTVGRATYQLSLTSGDATVASAGGQHVMNPGAVSSVCPNTGCLYNAVKVSLTPQVDRVAAADGLRLTLSGSGAWTHAAISTTATRGASSITLPIAATGGGKEAPTVTYEAAEPPIQLSYGNETTAIVQYNWTGNASLHVLAQVDAGNLTLNLTQNGTPVLDFNGTTLNQTVSCPATCEYALRVAMDGFIGSLLVEETEGAPEATDTPPATGGTEPADGAQPTGNESLDGEVDGKDTPAPALVLAVAALALAGRRRR